MPLEEETLPQVLKKAGYQRHAVGKWHLGHSSFDYTPTFRGFESFYGFYAAGKQDYFKHTTGGAYDMRNDTQEFCGKNCSHVPNDRGVYSSELYARESKRIIRDTDPSKGPLFLYLAFQAIHGPYQVPERYVKRHNHMKKRWSRPYMNYAGLVAAADDAIGEIIKQLQDSNMWEDTLVVYTTDNGGDMWICDERDSTNKDKKCTRTGSNRPMRGGKHDVWEGGVNGEGFLSGPAMEKLGIKPGKKFSNFVMAMDWLPTLAAITGVEPSGDNPLDGVNQLDNFRGEGPVARDELFLGYSLESEAGKGDKGERGAYAAIRKDKWKLLRKKNGSSYLLYDLSKDPRETKNVKKQHPNVARTLKNRLLEYEANFTNPARDDRQCKKLHTFKRTKWGQKLWEPWCETTILGPEPIGTDKRSSHSN
jgi:arylsulfatase B